MRRRNTEGDTLALAACIVTLALAMYGAWALGAFVLYPLLFGR